MSKYSVFLGYMAVISYSQLVAFVDLYKMIYYNAMIPSTLELRDRVLMTVCCNDCHYLSKVEHAGSIQMHDHTPCQIMHNGIKVLKDCYYGAWMTVLIKLLKGHHEPQEEMVFHEVLKYLPNHAVMVELGSYWGYYSMWFQHVVPGARTYLVEPDPKNLSIGKENFRLNSMHGHFIHAMVGSDSVDVHQFIDWDYNIHQVKQICMDDFVEEMNVDFIHVLHSDIQGAEVNMLRGCKKLIAQNRIGYFFISTHKGVHQECLNILQEAGLDILVSITRKESFSADGLIVAKLPALAGPECLEVSRRTDQFCHLINGVIDAQST